jgi:hypothetical protein
MEGILSLIGAFLGLWILWNGFRKLLLLDSGSHTQKAALKGAVRFLESMFR